MTLLVLPILLFLSGCCSLPTKDLQTKDEGVVVLHGLLRSSRAMCPMAQHLAVSGYEVENVHYPSRSAPVAELAETYVTPAVTELRNRGVQRIHFVTHSLGGILTRHWLATHPLPELGNVVMLAPPNQGSEIVDCIGHWRSFHWINGPAGQELGTSPDSVPNQLPLPHYPVAVYTGTRSINPILSMMIPGTDDGKVSTERAKLEGMADYRTFPVTHPLIMRNREVKKATLAFLERE